MVQPTFPRPAGHGAVRLDPAIEKYMTLNKERYKYFRWTARTARINFMYVVFVPSIVGYMFYKTDGKWDMRGKMRGDTIAEW